MLRNGELFHFFPLRKHFTPIPLHARFPEFEHVFSGMEMAVLALLRHWHEYPWRSKEKLKHWNEAWDWKFLSYSFICWWGVCVWHKGDSMNTASQRLYMNLGIHIQANIYTLLVWAYCWIRGWRWTLFIGGKRYLPLFKKTYVSTILLENSNNWILCVDTRSLLCPLIVLLMSFHTSSQALLCPQPSLLALPQNCYRKTLLHIPMTSGLKNNNKFPRPF